MKTKLTEKEESLKAALIVAFAQVREGGTFVPEFNEVDLDTMAQSMADMLD
jgi:hypothetical protein